jgi:hypothetical protein
VIGAPSHGGLSAIVDGSSSRELLRLTHSDVFIVNPEAPLQTGLLLGATESAGAR